MCDQVKSQKNNEKMISQFAGMSNMVNHHMQNIDMTKMA